MMLNGMKHICVGLLVALLSGTALAQSGPSGFSVVTDAVLVPSETVLGDDVEAQLGKYSVIKQSNVRAMSMSAQAQVTTDVRGEPIVCSPTDAFNCFMGTEMDVLAVGNYVLYKEQQDEALKKNYEECYELD